jgi:NAD(P)-dependent dehydrogenase (short-subunit alcohol dehydrogenase family)
MEYAKDGMRVNAVAPGVVYTPLHQDTPKEVMEANGRRKYGVDIVTSKRASRLTKSNGAEWRATPWVLLVLEQ